MSDPPDRETVCGLGNRKSQYFHESLQQDGVETFDSAVALIGRLRNRRIGVALVSSSRNARAVLETAGLEDLFDVVIDGNDIARLGLDGKPAPDLFLKAAELKANGADIVVADIADLHVRVRPHAVFRAVAIISGRDRADVEQLVGLDKLVYAGSHGFDIAGPTVSRSSTRKAGHSSQSFIALPTASSPITSMVATKRID